MLPSQQTTPVVLQTETVQQREQGLSFFSLTSLVIANMIGAGVFTTSGFALGDLGTPGRVLLAWLVGGGVALCGALSYGALARRLTDSGGEYLFLSRAIHPLVGFLAGWVSLLAGFTGAIAFAAYALPVDGRDHASDIPAPAVGARGATDTLRPTPQSLPDRSASAYWHTRDGPQSDNYRFPHSDNTHSLVADVCAHWD